MKKTLIKICITLGVTAVVIGGMYLLYPLLVDREVNESFPMFTDKEIATMTPEEREEKMQEIEREIMRLSAEAPDTVVAESMPTMFSADTQAVNNTPRLLTQGIFRDADSFHKGSGDATIYELTETSRTLRLENFEVTNGPDLHVLLSKSDNPFSEASFEGSEYIDLGKLKGNIGNQNYTIPEDIDITEFKSVVIYCEPFNVVFSAATFE